MQRNALNQRALFIIGLLLGVILPITLRHHVSDGVRGMITGAGIGLLLLAVVRKRRQPKEI